MVSLHFNKGVYHYYILGRQNNTLPTLSSHLLQLETWSICTFNNWKNEGRTSHLYFFLHSFILIFFFIFYQKVEYGKKGLF